jgi:hypothetical protein
MKTHLQIELEKLGHYAIPIFTVRRRSQSPYLVGSGTLYRFSSEIFLITAMHVVDELEDGLIVTGGKTGFIRFAAEKAAFEYSKGTGRDHDICVIRILPSVAENLNTHYLFVKETEVSVVGHYDKLTLYAFVGYPHSKNKPRPKSVSKEIEVKPFYYALREFQDIGQLNTKDKFEDLHVAFNAPFKKFRDITLQNHIQVPNPHGISGCGVWKVKLNRTTGQIDKLSLVAVGIEYLKKDNTFVATRIHSPLSAIMKFKGMLNKANAADAKRRAAD